MLNMSNESVRELFSKIEDFLAVYRKSSSGLGGFAEITEEDVDQLYDIIGDLIKLKCEADPDGNYPIEVSKYPPVIKELEDIASSSSFRPGLGILSISYPSLTAEYAGLKGDFFAVVGDGIFLHLIEILPDGKGFRICKDPTPGNPGRRTKEFCQRTSRQVGDILTSEELISDFIKCYGDDRGVEA